MDWICFFIPALWQGATIHSNLFFPSLWDASESFSFFQIAVFRRSIPHPLSKLKTTAGRADESHCSFPCQFSSHAGVVLHADAHDGQFADFFGGDHVAQTELFFRPSMTFCALSKSEQTRANPACPLNC
jgi:hypothetical protein